MPLPWSMLITYPPPLLRHPDEVTIPDWAATIMEPYGAAMSSARCPAWKYWLMAPPGTGHTRRPTAGAATARTVGELIVAVCPTLSGPGSGVTFGSTAIGIGNGAGGGISAR